QKRNDLRGNITVSVNQDLAAKHIGQRFELEIAPRWQNDFTAPLRRFVSVPLLHVMPGFDEGFAQCFVNTHARGRKAANVQGLIYVRTLSVLSQRELPAKPR